MTLVDTSVWVEHFRRGQPRLADLLQRAQVAIHPFVIGELAMGSHRNRSEILQLLDNLPAVAVATHGEVLAVVEARKLHGTGLGWVDAHLLAAARLAQAPIWTLDRRLGEAADALGVNSGL